MEYLIFNGEIIKKTEANLTSLFWGEPFLLWQHMWFGYGGIPLFQENIENLLEQMRLFGSTPPPLFKNKREFFRITKRMLNKNKYFRSGVITVQLFINEKAVQFVMESEAAEIFDFPISENGSLVSFSEVKKDENNPFCRYNFCSRSFWKKGLADLQQTEFQNSLFFNENNCLCEAISSNVFLIKGRELITPSLKTGCFEDNLRKHVISAARQLNLTVQESDNIQKNEIFQMNEIFLASESIGLEWVLGIENKRFVRQVTLTVHRQIKEYLKKLAT